MKMAGFLPNPLDKIRADIQNKPNAAKKFPKSFGPPGSQHQFPAAKPATPAAPGPQQPAPGNGPAAPGGPPTVQTSINPTPIYTPQMTNQAVNQAFATAMPDLNSVVKQFDRPGVSRSAGTMAAAMPQMAEGALTAMQAQAEIPLQDMMANQQHLMAGEVAREQQGLDLANLLARNQQIATRGQLGMQGQNMNLLLQALQGSMI
jgi:hypothetical protein